MRTLLPSATNFQDIPVQGKPPYDGFDFLCPVCKGHGKWNYDLNAYGEGKHFQGGCIQCNGWGWVPRKDATCVHHYQEIGSARCKALGITHYGKCWHVYECTKCKRVTAHDSSD